MAKIRCRARAPSGSDSSASSSPSKSRHRSRERPTTRHDAIDRFRATRQARGRTGIPSRRSARRVPHVRRPGRRSPRASRRCRTPRARLGSCQPSWRNRRIGPYRIDRHDIAIPLLLDAAERDYPAVKVNIEEDTSVALVDRLIDAHIDLAVIASSAVRSDVIFEPLFEEELIAAIPTQRSAPSRHRSPTSSRRVSHRSTGCTRGQP